MSPRFIQALKSLGAQHLTKHNHAQPIIEQPIISSSSMPTTAINILQDLLSDIQYTLSDIKLSITQTFTLHDKSQSEILFLLAILLTILLFVVILPIYEAVITTDEDEVTQIRNKVEKEVPLISAPLKMYKPGVGIVEVTYDSEPSLLRMASSDTSSSSDRSLNGSICTHHSLETIEESEEEYILQDEEEEQQEESEEEVVPGLDTTAVDEDEDEEETVGDKVKYYEFLSYCNSDD